jgi:hypothetical protein
MNSGLGLSIHGLDCDPGLENPMYPSDAAQAKSARPNQHEHGATPRPPQTSPAPAAARCSFLLRRLEGRLPLTAPLPPVRCAVWVLQPRDKKRREAASGARRRRTQVCPLLRSPPHSLVWSGRLSGGSTASSPLPGGRPHRFRARPLHLRCEPPTTAPPMEPGHLRLHPMAGSPSPPDSASPPVPVYYFILSV